VFFDALQFWFLRGNAKTRRKLNATAAVRVERRRMISEADTCRKYVLPKLYAAGWNDD
jgi:hypothetical protein